MEISLFKYVRLHRAVGKFTGLRNVLHVPVENRTLSLYTRTLELETLNILSVMKKFSESKIKKYIFRVEFLRIESETSYYRSH